MKKIAFYLNNPMLPKVDYSTIMNGNPGIGGSEYEFLLVSFLLEERDNGILSFLITNSGNSFPHKNVVPVSDLRGCCDYCAENDVDCIVIDIKHFDKNVLDDYSGKLDVIIWAHNNVSFSQLDLFCKLDYIRKIVNCGREELELYRDHIATLKSTYIYNIFPVREKSFYLKQMKDRTDNFNVVYMGSLVKVKGFHVLARAWKKILKRIPDAQLFVIGSGKLYDSTAVLGKYGIADERYEELFIPYLLGKDGQLLSSVHFLGVLGEEKFEVLGSCKVAVPNPTGLSETFSITALEMQLMGCNTTTKYYSAYLDTVYNNSSLYKSCTQLADYVVRRFQENLDSFDNLYEYVATNFGINGNIEKWERILITPDCNTLEDISSYDYHHKKAKDFLLRFKIRHSWARNLPCIEQWYVFLDYISGKVNDVLDLLRIIYYKLYSHKKAL